MARSHDVNGICPMLPLAVPGPLVEIETRFLVWPITSGVALAPAAVLGIVFRSTKPPHVVERPDDGLFDTTNIGNGEHFSLNPMQMNNIGIAEIYAFHPPRWKI